MKGKNAKRLIVGTVSGLFVLLTIVALFANSTVSTLLLGKNSVKNTSITFKDVYGVDESIELNPAKTWNNYRNMDVNYELDGKDIVKKATEVLGAPYMLSNKGGKRGTSSSEEVIEGGIDCSGLVYWSLNQIGVKTSGFHLEYDGADSFNDVPLNCEDWYTYGNNESNYFCEVGAWKKPNKDTSKPYEFYLNERAYGKDSVYNTKLEYRYGDSKDNIKDIQVLKVNDPIIESKLEYFEYYEGNVKKTLPIGTVVVSLGRTEKGDVQNGVIKEKSGTYNHAWITIGDLGTTNKDEAIKKLKDMGILDSNKDYSGVVFGDESEDWGDKSNTYWKIESTGKNGALGVRIDNGLPRMGESSQQTSKSIGPVWAFQFGRGEVSGSYEMNIAKCDEERK